MVCFILSAENSNITMQRKAHAETEMSIEPPLDGFMTGETCTEKSAAIGKTENRCN